MKKPFVDPTQTDEGWQAVFAFQIFHQQPEDWLKMRWGFNAGILLEEALDRGKLFVESQTASEIDFRSGAQPVRTVALRGINLPGTGLQMSLLGKTIAQSRQAAEETALVYARELYSTFPSDFILIPAETPDDFHRLSGQDLLTSQPGIAQIQRSIFPLPPGVEFHFLTGLWQASARSNEQIWRALSNMPRKSMVNMMMQPTYFFEGEKKALIEIKQKILDAEQNSHIASVHGPWVENIVKRRLAAWKRFFLVQVHVAAEHELDENLIRSIGSALTRDSNDLSLPGFQTQWPDSDETGRSWCDQLLALNFIPSAHMEDLCDSDEAFAVFRVPYLPEAGVPGANFIRLLQELPPDRPQQGQ